MYQKQINIKNVENTTQKKKTRKGILILVYICMYIYIPLYF